MKKRPSFILNLAKAPLTQITRRESDEKLASYFDFGQIAKFRDMFVRLDVLKPGRRTSSPHAHTDTDEFVLILEGTPDVWIDGYLHRLKKGDALCFEAGTGVAHTFINNTKKDVKMLAVADVDALDKTFYPLKPQPLDNEDSASDLRLVESWFNRELGPHDGLPSSSKKKSKK